MGHCGNLVSFSSATIKLLKLHTNHWHNWKQHLQVRFLYDGAKENNRLYSLPSYLLSASDHLGNLCASVRNLWIYVSFTYQQNNWALKLCNK